VEYILLDILFAFVAFACSFAGAMYGHRVALKQLERQMKARKVLNDLVDTFTRDIPRAH